MFMAIVMACGISAEHPAVVNGLTIAFSKVPTVTRLECEEILGNILESATSGMVVTYADCLHLGRPLPNV